MMSPSMHNFPKMMDKVLVQPNKILVIYTCSGHNSAHHPKSTQTPVKVNEKVKFSDFFNLAIHILFSWSINLSALVVR